MRGPHRARAVVWQRRPSPAQAGPAGAEKDCSHMGCCCCESTSCCRSSCCHTGGGAGGRAGSVTARALGAGWRRSGHQCGGLGGRQQRGGLLREAAPVDPSGSACWCCCTSCCRRGCRSRPSWPPGSSSSSVSRRRWCSNHLSRGMHGWRRSFCSYGRGKEAQALQGGGGVTQGFSFQVDTLFTELIVAQGLNPLLTLNVCAHCVRALNLAHTHKTSSQK